MGLTSLRVHFLRGCLESALIRPQRRPAMLTSSDRPPLGHVVSITGSYGHVQLKTQGPSDQGDDFRVTVGKFLALQASTSIVVSVITGVDRGKGEDGGLVA